MKKKAALENNMGFFMQAFFTPFLKQTPFKPDIIMLI
jgi:hypothetical protein